MQAYLARAGAPPHVVLGVLPGASRRDVIRAYQRAIAAIAPARFAPNSSAQAEAHAALRLAREAFATLAGLSQETRPLAAVRPFSADTRTLVRAAHETTDGPCDLAVVATHADAVVGLRVGPGIRATLPKLQLTLLIALARHQAAAAAGTRFVAGRDLVASLPWEAKAPTLANLAHAVRRVRKTLERAGLAALVETQHRCGYRLTRPVRLVTAGVGTAPVPPADRPR